MSDNSEWDEYFRKTGEFIDANNNVFVKFKAAFQAVGYVLSLRTSDYAMMRAKDLCNQMWMLCDEQLRLQDK